MRTIDINTVISKTSLRCSELRRSEYEEIELAHQIICLAEVLTSEINESLEELQSWITPVE